MSRSLSPPKAVLLAVKLADEANVEELTILASQHPKVLRKDILLRIILTYLPETCTPVEYLPLLQALLDDALDPPIQKDLDVSSVQNLSNEAASRKVKKLSLLPLKGRGVPADLQNDAVAAFLLCRAYRLDEDGAGIAQVPDLLGPFASRWPYIHGWMVSTVLPLLRRNYEYYHTDTAPKTLGEFETMTDRAAVAYLLSQTGSRPEDYQWIGRDLRGLVGPWLHNEARWKRRSSAGLHPSPKDTTETQSIAETVFCTGWEQALEWLVSQASRTWQIAVKAIEQWDGPADVDFGGYGSLPLGEAEQRYLQRRFARAALASAYCMQEPTIEALTGAHAIISKIVTILNQDPLPALPVAASLLSPTPSNRLASDQNVTHLRNNLLRDTNPLTTPEKPAIELLHTLILSASLLTKAGVPTTVRRAGELCLLQNIREQEEEATKFIHAIGSNGTKSDDKYWIRVRNELLWLRDWGAEEAGEGPTATTGAGPFGQLKPEFLEKEMLKALLANSRE